MIDTVADVLGVEQKDVFYLAMPDRSEVAIEYYWLLYVQMGFIPTAVEEYCNIVIGVQA